MCAVARRSPGPAVTKTPSAKIPCARDHRNSAQPGPSQRGSGPIPASLGICQTVDGPPRCRAPRTRRGCGGSPTTHCHRPAAAPPTENYGASAGVRSGRGATAAPSGGRRCRDAPARSWPERRSAASLPAGRLAASRRAGAATRGAGTSTSNEREAARTGPPRADDAASRSCGVTAIQVSLHAACSASPASPGGRQIRGRLAVGRTRAGTKRW
jgi:hypothetical protein